VPEPALVPVPLKDRKIMRNYIKNLGEQPFGKMIMYRVILSEDSRHVLLLLFDDRKKFEGCKNIWA
jgi:hypothetical protein